MTLRDSSRSESSARTATFGAPVVPEVRTSEAPGGGARRDERVEALRAARALAGPDAHRRSRTITARGRHGVVLHEQGCLGEVEHSLELLLGEVARNRERVRAQLGEGEGELEVLDATREPQRDPFPRTHAKLGGQRVREPGGPPVPLPPAHPALASTRARASGSSRAACSSGWAGRPTAERP